MNKTFRNNGTIGALLDEYEKAIYELKLITTNISPSELTTIIDNQTSDEDCRSIQTVLTHVVQSGYTYVVEIRKHEGEKIKYKEKVFLKDVQSYHKALDDMFVFNIRLFEDYPDITLQEYDVDKKFTTRWGQLFDVEQLFNHAIVHVLKHRRQIERWISTKNT